MTSKLLAPAVAIAAATAIPTPGEAAIVAVTGAPGVSTDENVLFKNLGPASVIVTSTNKDTQVTFTGNEILDATAGGQAKITGADGDLTALNFFLTDPAASLGAVEFSISGPNGRRATDNVLATIRFFDQFGAVTTIENAPLSTGQNWFAAYATMASQIGRVEITTSAAIRDIRHVRISAAAAAPVPEPGTWLMFIAGFGLLGSAMRAGRRQAAAGRVVMPKQA